MKPIQTLKILDRAKRKKIVSFLQEQGIKIDKTAKHLIFLQHDKNIYVFSGMIEKEELEKMKREINIKRTGMCLMHDDEINQRAVDMLRDKLK